MNGLTVAAAIPKAFLIPAIILLVLIVILIVLYFLGKKAEKKQASQQDALKSHSQTMSIFVIDKKKVRLKDAGLPSIVMENSPRLAKLTKVPVVKAKAGPRVINFIADSKIYDQILPKQEGKATVSGIYITGFRRTRGPVVDDSKKKKKKKK